MSIVIGDCIEVMASMPEASVDAVVCDPPYGLEFMGKEWDRLIPPARGRTAGLEHAPTIEESNDSPHHRAAIKQPSVLKRCGRCGGNSSGEWGRCQCESPDFRQNMAPIRAMQDWHEAWATEALRVLKPGGHLLAFGGTRTYHRLAAGIEDAGFEIRDTIAWMYGSGFPKSLDLSKAIDKAAGAERDVVGERAYAGGHVQRSVAPRFNGTEYANGEVYSEPPIRYDTAPATAASKAWEGWGTALKPAHEPIVVARKPLAGTVAGNVLAHGTGALNIDGCRIGEGHDNGRGRTDEASGDSRYAERGSTNFAATPGPRGGDSSGRWPANVVLDEAAGAMLDAQTGELTSGANPTRRGADGDRVALGEFNGQTECHAPRGVDTGGASRFFYCAKTSATERNAGLGANVGFFSPADAPERNEHPTVKPIALMRWLCRLVTPPGGLVLDPFAGSGTTGCAAALEGFRFTGIERSSEYAAIARARLAHWELAA